MATPATARARATPEITPPVPGVTNALKATDPPPLSCLQTRHGQICHGSYENHTRAILRAYALFPSQQTPRPQHQPRQIPHAPPSLHSPPPLVASLPSHPQLAPLHAISTRSPALAHEHQAKQTPPLTPTRPFPRPLALPLKTCSLPYPVTHPIIGLPTASLPIFVLHPLPISNQPYGLPHPSAHIPHHAPPTALRMGETYP